MIQDFRFAVRQLIKAPGFTAVAVFTLALAIGVNSAIFAIVNAVVFRPVVPLRPHEVVNVFTAKQNANRDYRQFSFAEFQTLRENGEVFADVAAVQFGLAGIGRDERLLRSAAVLTSDNFFTMVGVKPLLGRFYNADEGRPNANIPVVVVSHGFWKRQGGRPEFVGSSLYVNGAPYTVIGITPEGFSGLSALLAPDVFIPLGMYSQFGNIFADVANLRDLQNPKNYTLNIMARMAPGLTIEQAQTRLPVLAQRLTAIQPADAGSARDLQIQTPSRVSLSTSPSDDAGQMRMMGLLMMAMATAVLLIASLNLANMLLARGTARAKEMAIRLALGSSRWRIIRQLLCEGLGLAVLGGAFGLLLSMWSNGLLLRSLASLIGSMSFTIVVPVRPDMTVLAVTFLFCLFATLLFSLGPALKSTRADLVNDLKQQVGDPAIAGRFNRFFAPRHLLVMMQIALSLMLIFAAGLFLRGAIKAGGVDPGFKTEGGLVAELDFTLTNVDAAAAQRTMFSTLQRTRELPGVRSAALASMIPYGNETMTKRVLLASEAATAQTDPNAPDPSVNALYTSITPGYFGTIGVRLLQGRDFNQLEAETKDSPRVAIIDEMMAKKMFPNGNAIGQRIKGTTPPADGSSGEMEIVGIVSGHRHEVTGATIPRRLYVPLGQVYKGAVFLHVQTQATERAAVTGMIGTLRQTLRNVDPDMPVLQISRVRGLHRAEHQPLGHPDRCGDVRSVRRHRAAARRGWRLRRACLFRRAAHP